MNKVLLVLFSFFLVLAYTQFHEASAALTVFTASDLLGDEFNPPFLPDQPRPNTDAAQASFLSMLSSSNTEDFEEIVPETVIGTSSSSVVINLDLGTMTLTAGEDSPTDQSKIVTYAASTTGSTNGRFPTSGDQGIKTRSSHHLTFTFSEPQAAFGFTLTDLGDSFDDPVTVTFSGINPPQTFTIPTESGITVVGYFGIIGDSLSDTFDIVTFDIGSGFGIQGFGIDDVSTARLSQTNPVEPIVIGGEIIPIETTSLILAGAQSFSWMIPVVLSVIGIGLVLVRKK